MKKISHTTAGRRPRFSLFLRLTALVLIFCFAAQELMYAEGAVPLLPVKNSSVSVSDKLGVTRSVRKFSDGEMVLNIQDAHASLGAQKSIAKILDSFVKNYEVGLIGVEGSSGAIDTSAISSFPVPEVRKSIAESLLHETKISASEFYKITSGSDIELYGVENNELYRRNVEDFKKVLESKDAVLKELSRLNIALNSLAGKIFPEEIVELNVKARAYREGELNFEGYWECLSKLPRDFEIAAGNYPNAEKLVRAMELEKSLNFKAAEAERDALMGEFRDKVSASGLEKIVLKALEFKVAKITPAQFYSFLRKEAVRYEIAFENRTQLSRYTDYVMLFESIDVLKVIEEIEKIDERTKRFALKTPEQIELNDRVKVVNILSSLLGGTLTSRDEEYFRENRASFEMTSLRDYLSTNKKDITVSEIPDFGLLQHQIPNAEKFYVHARQRNEALLSNLLSRMKKSGKKVGVLVAGGFHSEGLSELMSEQRVSHMVFMPKFDNKEGDRPYATVITQKDSYLDRELCRKEQMESIVLLIGLSVLSGMKLEDAKKLYLESYEKTKHGSVDNTESVSSSNSKVVSDFEKQDVAVTPAQSTIATGGIYVNGMFVPSTVFINSIRELVKHGRSEIDLLVNGKPYRIYAPRDGKLAYIKELSQSAVAQISSEVVVAPSVHVVPGFDSPQLKKEMDRKKIDKAFAQTRKAILTEPRYQRFREIFLNEEEVASIFKEILGKRVGANGGDPEAVLRDQKERINKEIKSLLDELKNQKMLVNSISTPVKTRQTAPVSLAAKVSSTIGTQIITSPVVDSEGLEVAQEVEAQAIVKRLKNSAVILGARLSKLNFKAIATTAKRILDLAVPNNASVLLMALVVILVVQSTVTATEFNAAPAASHWVNVFQNPAVQNENKNLDGFLGSGAEVLFSDSAKPLTTQEFNEAVKIISDRSALNQKPRRRAIVQLGNSGQPQAISHLLNVLEYFNKNKVRRQIKNVSAELDWGNMMPDFLPGVKIPLIAQINALNTAITALRGLKENNEDAQSRALAALAIGHLLSLPSAHNDKTIRKAAEQLFQTVLRDPSSAVVQAALVSLTRTAIRKNDIFGRDFRYRMAELLNHEDWLVRLRATEAITTIPSAEHDQRVDQAIADRLMIENNLYVRTALIHAVGKYHILTALPQLLQSLPNASWEELNLENELYMRAYSDAVVVALLSAADGAPENKKQILQAIENTRRAFAGKHPDTVNRILIPAKEALGSGKTSPVPVMSMIITAAKTPSPNKRRDLLKELKSLDISGFIFENRKDNNLYLALLYLLEDQDWQVRSAALDIVEKTRTDFFRSAVEKMVRTDANPTVKTKAIKLLGSVPSLNNSVSAEAYLEVILARSEIRTGNQAVSWAESFEGALKGIQELLKGLESEDAKNRILERKKIAGPYERIILNGLYEGNGHFTLGRMTTNTSGASMVLSEFQKMNGAAVAGFADKEKDFQDEKSFGELVKILLGGDQRPGRRVLAILALEEKYGVVALGPISFALADPFPGVQANAGYALGRLFKGQPDVVNGDEVLSKLGDFLKQPKKTGGERSREAKIAAIDALRNIGTPKSALEIAGVEINTKDPKRSDDPLVLLAVLEALGSMGQAATPALDFVIDHLDFTWASEKKLRELEEDRVSRKIEKAAAEAFSVLVKVAREDVRTRLIDAITSHPGEANKLEMLRIHYPADFQAYIKKGARLSVVKSWKGKFLGPALLLATLAFGVVCGIGQNTFDTLKFQLTTRDEAVVVIEHEIGPGVDYAKNHGLSAIPTTEDKNNQRNDNKVVAENSLKGAESSTKSAHSNLKPQVDHSLAPDSNVFAALGWKGPKVERLQKIIAAYGEEYKKKLIGNSKRLEQMDGQDGKYGNNTALALAALVTARFPDHAVRYGRDLGIVVGVDLYQVLVQGVPQNHGDGDSTTSGDAMEGTEEDRSPRPLSTATDAKFLKISYTGNNSRTEEPIVKRVVRISGNSNKFTGPAFDARAIDQFDIRQSFSDEHPATDVALARRTPIRAGIEGDLKRSWDPLSGNYVKITDQVGDDIFSISYAHLEDYAMAEGRVGSDEIVGYSGNSGRTKGENGGYSTHVKARINGQVVPVGVFLSRYTVAKQIQSGQSSQQAEVAADTKSLQDSLDMLLSGDPRARQTAAMALKGTKSLMVASALLKRISSSENLDVKIAAVHVLETMGGSTIFLRGRVKDTLQEIQKVIGKTTNEEFKIGLLRVAAKSDDPFVLEMLQISGGDDNVNVQNAVNDLLSERTVDSTQSIDALLSSMTTPWEHKGNSEADKDRAARWDSAARSLEKIARRSLGDKERVLKGINQTLNLRTIKQDQELTLRFKELKRSIEQIKFNISQTGTQYSEEKVKPTLYSIPGPRTDFSSERALLLPAVYRASSEGRISGGAPPPPKTQKAVLRSTTTAANPIAPITQNQRDALIIDLEGDDLSVSIRAAKSLGKYKNDPISAINLRRVLIRHIDGTGSVTLPSLVKPILDSLAGFDPRALFPNGNSEEAQFRSVLERVLSRIDNSVEIRVSALSVFGNSQGSDVFQSLKKFLGGLEAEFKNAGNDASINEEKRRLINASADAARRLIQRSPEDEKVREGFFEVITLLRKIDQSSEVLESLAEQFYPKDAKIFQSRVLQPIKKSHTYDLKATGHFKVGQESVDDDTVQIMLSSYEKSLVVRTIRNRSSNNELLPDLSRITGIKEIKENLEVSSDPTRFTNALIPEKTRGGVIALMAHRIARDRDNDPNLVQALINQALQEQNSNFFVPVLQALSALESPEGVDVQTYKDPRIEVFRRFSKMDNAAVLSNLAFLLSTSKDPEALEITKGLLKHKSPNVVTAAILSFVTKKDARSLMDVLSIQKAYEPPSLYNPATFLYSRGVLSKGPQFDAALKARDAIIQNILAGKASANGEADQTLAELTEESGLKVNLGNQIAEARRESLPWAMVYVSAFEKLYPGDQTYNSTKALYNFWKYIVFPILPLLLLAGGIAYLVYGKRKRASSEFSTLSHLGSPDDSTKRGARLSILLSFQAQQDEELVMRTYLGKPLTLIKNASEKEIRLAREAVIRLLKELRTLKGNTGPDHLAQSAAGDQSLSEDDYEKKLAGRIKYFLRMLEYFSFYLSVITDAELRDKLLSHDNDFGILSWSYGFASLLKKNTDAISNHLPNVWRLGNELYEVDDVSSGPVKMYPDGREITAYLEHFDAYLRSQTETTVQRNWSLGRAIRSYAAPGTGIIGGLLNLFTGLSGLLSFFDFVILIFKIVVLPSIGFLWSRLSFTRAAKRITVFVASFHPSDLAQVRVWRSGLTPAHPYKPAQIRWINAILQESDKRGNEQGLDLLIAQASSEESVTLVHERIEEIREILQEVPYLVIPADDFPSRTFLSLQEFNETIPEYFLKLAKNKTILKNNLGFFRKIVTDPSYLEIHNIDRLASKDLDFSSFPSLLKAVQEGRKVKDLFVGTIYAGGFVPLTTALLRLELAARDDRRNKRNGALISVDDRKALRDDGIVEIRFQGATVSAARLAPQSNSARDLSLTEYKPLNFLSKTRVADFLNRTNFNLAFIAASSLPVFLYLGLPSQFALFSSVALVTLLPWVLSSARFENLFGFSSLNLIPVSIQATGSRLIASPEHKGPVERLREVARLNGSDGKYRIPSSGRTQNSPQATTAQAPRENLGARLAASVKSEALSERLRRKASSALFKASGAGSAFSKVSSQNNSSFQTSLGITPSGNLAVLEGRGSIAARQNNSTNALNTNLNEVRGKLSSKPEILNVVDNRPELVIAIVSSNRTSDQIETTRRAIQGVQDISSDIRLLPIVIAVASPEITVSIAQGRKVIVLDAINDFDYAKLFSLVYSQVQDARQELFKVDVKAASDTAFNLPGLKPYDLRILQALQPYIKNEEVILDSQEIRRVKTQTEMPYAVVTLAALRNSATPLDLQANILSSQLKLAPGSFNPWILVSGENYQAELDSLVKASVITAENAKRIIVLPASGKFQATEIYSALKYKLKHIAGGTSNLTPDQLHIMGGAGEIDLGVTEPSRFLSVTEVQAPTMFPLIASFKQGVPGRIVRLIAPRPVDLNEIRRVIERARQSEVAA